MLEYTDKTTLSIDLQLYLAFTNKSQLNLSLFPKIAADRWAWFYKNWDTTYKKPFKEAANGDEYLEAGLEQLANYIVGWRSGSNVNPFQNIEFFSEITEFLDLIPLDSLQLTTAEAEYVELQRKRINEFNADTFKKMLRYLREQRDLASDFIGLSDETYNKFKGRSSAKKQRDYFVSDMLQLDQATEIEDFVLGVLLDFKNKRNIEPNLLAIANKNLEPGSGVAVEDVFKSYKIVPFEQSLEQMAKDYLGTQNRWFELVSVNNLKAPYVDLLGVKEYILENANSNSLRVLSNREERFKVGATLKIGSRVAPEEIRKVEQALNNQDGTTTLFLSGDQDLGKLKFKHQAYVRIYLPETLHDFSYVKIPVTAVSPYVNLPASLKDQYRKLDKALYAFGIDIALDDSTGDIVIGANGDLKLLVGLPNVSQAVRNVINTALGELPLHPQYGLPNSLGQSLGGDSASRISVIIQQAIARDPRFTEIIVGKIVVSPEGHISMSVGVKIAGGTQLIPLSFVL